MLLGLLLSPLFFLLLTLAARPLPDTRAHTGRSAPKVTLLGAVVGSHIAIPCYPRHAVALRMLLGTGVPAQPVGYVPTNSPSRLIGCPHPAP